MFVIRDGSIFIKIDKISLQFDAFVFEPESSTYQRGGGGGGGRTRICVQYIIII